MPVVRDLAEEAAVELVRDRNGVVVDGLVDVRIGAEPAGSRVNPVGEGQRNFLAGRRARNRQLDGHRTVGSVRIDLVLVVLEIDDRVSCRTKFEHGKYRVRFVVRLGAEARVFLDAADKAERTQWPVVALGTDGAHVRVEVDAAIVTIAAAEAPVGAELAEAFADLRLLGDDVDRAAGRDGTVQYCARATDDLEALDCVAGRIGEMYETVAEELTGIEAANALVVGGRMKLQCVALREQLEVGDNIGRDDLQIHRQVLERDAEPRCAVRRGGSVAGFAHYLDEVDDFFLIVLAVLGEDGRRLQRQTGHSQKHQESNGHRFSPLWMKNSVQKLRI